MLWNSCSTGGVQNNTRVINRQTILRNTSSASSIVPRPSHHAKKVVLNSLLPVSVPPRPAYLFSDTLNAVSYTHLTLPTKRIV